MFPTIAKNVNNLTNRKKINRLKAEIDGHYENIRKERDNLNAEDFTKLQLFINLYESTVQTLIDEYGIVYRHRLNK